MSTWRSDVRDALFGYAQSFQTANSAMVSGDVYKVRPGSLVPPCIYVGSLSEPLINQDASILQRRIMAEVVLVQRIIDPKTEGEAMDDMVDAFVSYLDSSSREHVAGGLISLVSTRDVELDFAGTIYSATVVTVEAQVQEGRS